MWDLIVSRLGTVSIKTLGGLNRFYGYPTSPSASIMAQNIQLLKAFKRHIWNYNNGDYDLLRNKALNIDWDSLKDESIDTYATNISNTILTITSECIPNKFITVKPSDPPWITSHLKRQIRKRRKAYKKKKQLINLITG